jgi:uncharacterized protein
MRVEELYVAPVKSLAMGRVERVGIGKRGIPGDRAFFLVDEGGRMYSQRDCGALTQVRARYDADPERLRLEFPDGSVAEGEPEPGEPLATKFFGKRDVTGTVVYGPWAEALSRFAGEPVRLVRVSDESHAFDAAALSLCSTESLAQLASHSGRDAVDPRRFRMNVVVSGVGPHGEDEWLGRRVRIGGAEVTVRALDSRCVITTHDPDTGEADLDTLKIIPSYRLDQPKQVNFGTYCSIATPGEIAVGDEVAPG